MTFYFFDTITELTWFVLISNILQYFTIQLFQLYLIQKMIAGIEPIDGGDRAFKSGARIVYLPQQPR
jgi:hypothetical protein